MTLDQLCYRLALTTAVHTQTVPLVLGYDSKIEKQKLFFSYIANYASNNVDYFFNYLLKEIIDTDYRLIVFKEFVMD